jgi:hypothetical protein
MAGLDMAHVPYRGGGPAIADLLGGQVDVTFAVVRAGSGVWRWQALCETGAVKEFRHLFYSLACSKTHNLTIQFV